MTRAAPPHPSGFNWNDGHGGNSHVGGNLVFNMVRETGDHGPYNSWDRQPYLTLRCTFGNSSAAVIAAVLAAVLTVLAAVLAVLAVAQAVALQAEVHLWAAQSVTTTLRGLGFRSLL